MNEQRLAPAAIRIRRPVLGHPAVSSVIGWSLPAVLLLAAFFIFDMPVFRSDGVAYYAWLHAFMHNHTVSLVDEYHTFQAVSKPPQFRVVPETGHVGSIFP